MRDEPGISLDEAVKEIEVLIEDAEDFVSSELEDFWDLAERYYNGETDLPIVENRSNVVKTEVRDAIRNTMPSVMRILMHARAPVQYIPSSLEHAAWVEQQGEYCQQKFLACGGYMALYSAIFEALKLRIGILKIYWIPSDDEGYESYTKVPFSIVEALIGEPTFSVDSFEQVEQNPLDPVPLYNISGTRSNMNGKIQIESVPNYEFFISRNVNSIEHAIDQGVHGHRAIVTVQDAIDMGLEYADWLTLDEEDPEQSDHTNSSTERRRYNKNDVNDVASEDVLNHKFLLTECYVTYDLKRTGRRQLYKFYFGGTSRTYLHHEEVEESPFAILLPTRVHTLCTATRSPI